MASSVRTDLKFMRPLILASDHLSVKFVGLHLSRRTHSGHIKRSTLQKSHTNVKFVERHSKGEAALSNTRGFTLVFSHLSVINVVGRSPTMGHGRNT